MPIKGGKMTAQEKAFSAHYAATGDLKYSATKAGYGAPSQRGNELMKRPAVLAEITRQQTERLFSEALPAAVQCLISIATNSAAPAGARVQASKVILDRTLGSEDGGKTKDPHEMTADEIAEAIAKLERVASERARPIVDRSTIDESPATIDESPASPDIFG